MERVGTLIHKLLEQYEQQAQAGRLLMTAQMLLAELQQQLYASENNTSEKVTIVIPAVQATMPRPQQVYHNNTSLLPGNGQEVPTHVAPVAQPKPVYAAAALNGVEAPVAEQQPVVSSETAFTRQQQVPQPEATQPEAAQPEVIHPTAQQPEVQQSVASQPEMSQPTPPQPATAQPVASQPPTNPLASEFIPEAALWYQRAQQAQAQAQQILQSQQQAHQPEQAQYAPQGQQSPQQDHSSEVLLSEAEQAQVQQPHQLPQTQQPEGRNISVTPAAEAAPQQQEQAAPQTVAPQEVNNPGRHWPFDPFSEVPTLAQQDNAKKAELNDSILSADSESLNEKLRVEKIELGSMLQGSPIRDLKKAIGINDRYLFINELFRGDETMYERSLKTINSFSILPEAQYWIQRELKVKLGWNESSESVHHFDQLVKRRFS